MLEMCEKGSKYWRFDPDQRPPVKDSYPRQENFTSYDYFT
jgi:hypothetical protein